MFHFLHTIYTTYTLLFLLINLHPPDVLTLPLCLKCSSLICLSPHTTLLVRFYGHADRPSRWEGKKTAPFWYYAGPRECESESYSSQWTLTRKQWTASSITLIRPEKEKKRERKSECSSPPSIFLQSRISSKANTQPVFTLYTLYYSTIL